MERPATTKTQMPLHYQNPVHGEYFADPFVWRHGDEYWAVGTSAHESPAIQADQPAVFSLLRSKDFVTWSPAGKALVKPEPGLGDTFWAPEVAFHDGVFHLYYSVGRADRDHQLRVATSRAPGGPYRDTGAPLLALSSCPFAIDPHPFRDDDGRWYLFYARDFLDEEQGARPGTALVVQELVTMTRLGAGAVVLRARHDWQRFLRDREMYGARFDWHTLEGPAVCKRDGRYYCFYSGGRWETSSYGVDYAVADHVLGPYTDGASAAGPRVLRSVPDQALGPGHSSLIVAPDGVTSFLAYHAWDRAFQARRMCLDPLVWGPEGPRCQGPSWTRQRLESRVG
jgi:beta-xylosidase